MNKKQLKKEIMATVRTLALIKLTKKQEDKMFALLVANAKLYENAD